MPLLSIFTRTFFKKNDIAEVQHTQLSVFPQMGSGKNCSPVLAPPPPQPSVSREATGKLMSPQLEESNYKCKGAITLGGADTSYD